MSVSRAIGCGAQARRPPEDMARKTNGVPTCCCRIDPAVSGSGEDFKKRDTPVARFRKGAAL